MVTDGVDQCIINPHDKRVWHDNRAGYYRGQRCWSPAVEHTLLKAAMQMDVPLLARATDDIAVYTTEIWVKAPEDEDWTIIEMSLRRRL